MIPTPQHPTDFIAIDTETGGLDATECALLSIAAVPSWGAEPFVALIQPVGKIEKKAAAVNGYTPELWAERGAMPAKFAAIELQRWLYQFHGRRFDLAAHNAGFDALFVLAFQQLTGIDLELPGRWHCTKIKMQRLREKNILPCEGRNRLDDLGTLSGYWDLHPRSAAHDALQDADCVRHSLPWLRRLELEAEATPEKKESAPQ